MIARFFSLLIWSWQFRSAKTGTDKELLPCSSLISGHVTHLYHLSQFAETKARPDSFSVDYNQPPDPSGFQPTTLNTKHENRLSSTSWARLWIPADIGGLDPRSIGSGTRGRQRRSKSSAFYVLFVPC